MRLAYSIGRYRPDQKRYPESVVDLRGKDLKAYGRQYMDETRPYRVTDRPFFTDKLPNNFSHVGLLHLILPNARIINARRHPFDSCLGGYKQLFGKGQNFTYDMADLSAYYRQYYETMRHWHTGAAGQGAGRALRGNGDRPRDAGPPHPRALRPAVRGGVRALPRESAARCSTASSEQVRRPIYTDALGHWRRFETHLGMWREDFADILEELPPTVRNAGLLTRTSVSRRARPPGRGWRCARPWSG